MARHYLTAIQAETLARMFYHLPPRNHRGQTLRNQHLVTKALKAKRLIIAGILTEKGVIMLRSYCDWLRSKQA